MPDLHDLHAEFARLEQEVPDGYRSPLIAERVSQIVAAGRRPSRPPRQWAGPATALLAAAVVLAIAVVAVAINRRGSGEGQPGHGGSISATPSPTLPSRSTAHSTSSVPTTHTSATNSTPVDSAALKSYVLAGKAVKLSDYERGEMGPGQPMVSTPGSAQFNTPSGNISCDILFGPSTNGADISCEAQVGPFIPPKPASCQMDWAGYFGFISGRPVTVGACVGGPEFGPTTMTLPYGSTLNQGIVACRSESGFLACVDLQTGHGFAVNRDTLKTY